MTKLVFQAKNLLVINTMNDSHKGKKKGLDIKKNDHSGKHSPHSHNQDDKVEPKNATQGEPNAMVKRDDAWFALPSEQGSQNLDEILEKDGYLVEKPRQIVRKGSKIGTEFNTHSNANNSQEGVVLGRKGNTSWSQNIKDLRKNFGFSWKRFGRKSLVAGLVVILLLVVSTTTVSAVLIDIWNTTPSIDDLERDPNQSSVVYARDGKTKIFEFYQEERREVVSLCLQNEPIETQPNCIPTEMQLAIVALEDENFHDNELGIPWRNIAGAGFKCFTSVGDECRGASGLSQQLIKNITEDDDRSVDRKIRELFTAVQLNENTSTTEILDKYLNWVPFGRNAYGVQQASRSYFNKDIKDINIIEACYLSSMVQQTSYFEGGVRRIGDANIQISNGLLGIENVDETVVENVDGQEIAVNVNADDSALTAARDLEFRKNVCLQKLEEKEFPLENGVRGKYIESKDQLLSLQTTPVVSTTDEAAGQVARTENKVAFVTLPVSDPYPHFREYITKELTKFISETELYEEGYDIITTLDPQIQQDVTQIVAESEPQITRFEANNASAVVVDGPTGQVVAMVGSLAYNRADIDGKVNIATSAQQPGSSIKPYIYAAAFRNGFNPGTMINDMQTNWGSYTPKNFDNRFRGPVSMRRALQGSLNIPAVKTLFLVNDDPASNQASKLDTFFNYTESMGVVFPCVEGASNPDRFGVKNAGVETCAPNEIKGVTAEDVKNAYRGRCFIASALGGCEVTLLSHTTGINTFLQEGNLRTATPFISIKKKKGGEDVYLKKQSSATPVYPVKDADEENKLIARQVTQVMSDYSSRAAEFGSSRTLLELKDKRWKVAAKTGTSNGPRDLWTVGGTPYYSISVWVGRTDNGAMASNVSSSIGAAPVWNRIMEYMHNGKEVKNFSTEGLTRVFVNSRTGLNNNTPADPNQPAEPQRPTGSVEYLTKKQIEQLNKKTGVVALATPAEVEKYKAQSIFENRSTVLPASYFVNKADGKLFVEGTTDESNKEEVRCFLLVAEFNTPAWRNPSDEWSKRDPSYCNIPEPSTQTGPLIAVEPDIATNLITGNNAISNVTMSASFPAATGLTVTTVRILRDGTQLASTAGAVTAAAVNPGPGNFVFEVTDNNGKVYTRSVSATIQAVPATYSNLSCPSTMASGSIVTCTLNYNPSTVTSARVYFSGGSQQDCQLSNGLARCPLAAIPNTTGAGFGPSVVISINGGGPTVTSVPVTVN